MILFIDVSQPEVHLALINKKIRHLKFTSQHISETLLPNIQRMIQQNKLTFKELKKTVVITGPGPFSRMRSAVVTANALAYALNIPVAGIKTGESINNLQWQRAVQPYYDREANITKPKS